MQKGSRREGKEKAVRARGERDTGMSFSFGKTAANPAPAPSTGVFGAPAVAAPAPGATGLFGAPAPAATGTAAAGFGGVGFGTAPAQLQQQQVRNILLLQSTWGRGRGGAIVVSETAAAVALHL